MNILHYVNENGGCKHSELSATMMQCHLFHSSELLI